MKNIKKNMLVVACLCIAAFSFTGCYETHYNHRYHHHTRGWYDRHHTPPPAGVNFDIDIRN